MTECKHNDFDEYFGKCSDCNATRQVVLRDEFINELQLVYGKLQDTLGISGDIAPEQVAELENKQHELATVVSKWLDSNCT